MPGQRVYIDNLEGIQELDLSFPVYQQTDGIKNKGQVLPVKRAFANVSASQTDSVLVAGVAGRIIRVLFWDAVAGATATDLTFNTKGSGNGVAITQKYANGINGGEVENVNPLGWFETNPGESLTVTTGAGSTTGIKVGYIEVS